MNTLSDESPARIERLSPYAFDLYLPWACAELRIDANVFIQKIHFIPSAKNQTMASAKLKKTKSRHETTDSDKESVQSLTDRHQKPIINSFNIVNICVTYDAYGNITQLKFNKNRNIPRQLIKLIGLIIHYHKSMKSIVINSGIKKECLHELNKLLLLSNITDVCLDNTAVHDGHYDLLLKETSKLKHLSIARCSIDDETLKNIAMNLTCPQPASLNLLLLNLSSNYITDVGAKHLATALRSNRKLVYLNLADNRITDTGAEELFDVLKVFLVTHEEMTSFRQRNIQYFVNRKLMINEILEKLKNADFESRGSKKKFNKNNNVGTNVAIKKAKEEKVGDKSSMDVETYWYDKAETITDEKMGPFTDPFSRYCVYTEDDKHYCYGNNNLAYINISYNHISYLTVKKILSVLITQQRQNRSPKGLVNVCLEGNCIPSKCQELEVIDSILLTPFKNLSGYKNKKTP